MRKSQLFISSFSEDAIRVARHYGLGLELDDPSYSHNLDDFSTCEEQMKKEREEAGSPSVLVHGPFTELNPGGIDPRAVALTAHRFDQAYRVCKRLGIQNMVLHSGFVPVLYEPEWHIQESIRFWKQWLAGKEAVKIVLENVFDPDPMILRKIVEGVASPNLGICLDLGHAHAFGSKLFSEEDWIQTLSPYLQHLHIHDNGGEGDFHQSLGEGTIPYEELFKRKELQREDLTFTLESRRAEPDVLWLLKHGILKKD